MPDRDARATAILVLAAAASTAALTAGVPVQEEMVMLELQASVAKSEADCRAKDEQLASLKLLLNGLQLELQRCSDAEKDLTVRPSPPSLCFASPASGGMG